MSASNRYELLASAARTSGGYSAGIAVPVFSTAAVGIDVTASSGTISFDAWLQGSDDGGTTWYDIPYSKRATSATAATDFAADTNRRNINGTSAWTTSPNKAMAVYERLPVDYVRLAYVITGSTPSVTFSASIVGK